MKKEDLRIIFLGNPAFAAHQLDVLLAEGFKIVAVVSAPDKAGGRGMKIRSTEVAELARKHQLPLLQPANLKSSDFLAELKSYRADLQVVIAFRMLPELVWDMPAMGTINLHASLLPNYRGAAPINWAIINGEEQSGVTTFKLKHAIDTGDLLLQEACDITPSDTAGSLHDKLMVMGAELMVNTLYGMISGELKEQPQQELSSRELKHAPKIFPEDCLLQFDHPLEEVHNKVRGLSPYPAARMEIDGKQLKVFKSHKKFSTNSLAPSMIDSDGKSYLRIACKDGWLYLDEVQLQGKRRMKIEDFLRGYRIGSES